MIDKLVRNVIARQALRYLGMLLAGLGIGASDLLADPDVTQIVMIAVGVVMSATAERAWVLARRLGLAT